MTDLIEPLACNDVDDIALAVVTILVHVYTRFVHVQLSDVDHLLDGFLDRSVDFSGELLHAEGRGGSVIVMGMAMALGTCERANRSWNSVPSCTDATGRIKEKSTRLLTN